MGPLRITAQLAGPVSLPSGPLHLDGLLAWAEAQRRQLPPIGFRPVEDIEIPIAREPGGRFHLCSSSIGAFDAHELRYVNRKFPIAEAQQMAGPKLKRINISVGAQKSYRIPTNVSFVENDELRWFAIGDAPEVEMLLGYVTHLGKRRAVGRGRVLRWLVEPTDPWGDDFPVARAGRPLRPLPADWPGLVDPVLARVAQTFPYWDKAQERVCAVPG